MCIRDRSCIAAKRFLIAESIYEEFESRFVAAMDNLKVGDPTREDTQIGPLATAAQLDEVEAQVIAAIHAGARLLTGGERMIGTGNYYAPTVLAGLPRTAPVYREEIFGPVAMLFRFTDIDEAIAIANDTPYGLAASVWTASRDEQRRFASALQCGAVFFNAQVLSLIHISSTLQNRLNQQKTKEKKLPRNWHSSYAPSCKIEVVEKTRETPAARRGFSCL